MTCPQCNTVNPDFAESCSTCGTPIPIGDDVTIRIVDTSALEPGSDFGPRYRIESLLGQGGMGRVYKAYDKTLDRVVAIKVVREGMVGEAGTALQRFKQELLLASKISHKNVLRIHDMGEVGPVKFISMAYVEGPDLYHILRDNPKLPLERALSFSQQLAEALAAAHGEGVIHRDLKPQNILVDKDDHIYVSDFGLAKSFQDDSAGMTRSGAFLGTPRYMSPEQVEGNPADQRSDLYAYGLILYEMVAGNVPFTGESTLKVMYQRLQETPKSPRLVNPSIPAWFNAVIMRCLEKDPAVRYQTANEILADLQAAKSSASASRAGISRMGSRTVQIQIPTFGRRRWIWAAAAAMGVLLIASTIVYRLKNPSNKPAAAHAPVSVLVADFTNHTGDPIFDGTLEPMVNVALEGASFINAYNRGAARSLARKLPHPTDQLDEQAARLVAVNQGISAVVTGELARRGDEYRLSATVLDSVTGNVLSETNVTAANKDDLLLDVPKLAAPIRKALGDTTPESVQVAAEQGSFTTTNLEAVHQYGKGVEQLFAGNTVEALQSYSKAIALDSNFARAYGGMSAVYANLGKTQDAEKYAKMAMEHVDRMTERERYRVRANYYFTMGDWQKCVEEYGELVKQYPADNVGQANLSGCFVELRNFPKAVEAARQAVQIAPQGALQRLNLSFNSSYAGDFKTGEQEARTALGLNRSSRAYLALAESQLGQGQMDQATETYHQLEKVDAEGASLAASGLADVATYEGRYAYAARTLEQGAAADLKAKSPDNAAEKLATLSHIEFLRGDSAAAVADATKALSASQTVPVRVLAALTFVGSGQISKAQTLAAGLASELQAEPQSYAKIIEGMIALKRGDNRQAIATLTDATKLFDTWISHFELGQAYLEAGLFVESDSEFDRCIQRRGEVLELFMDDTPTYGYLPDVYYYQGRVREGLKSPGFAEPYRTYLGIRGKAGEDPRLAEVRGRIHP